MNIENFLFEYKKVVETCIRVWADREIICLNINFLKTLKQKKFYILVILKI